MPDEPSRRERRRRAKELERAMRELDRLDRTQGLGAMPTGPAPRRTPPSLSPTLLGLMVTALLLGGVVLLSPGSEMQTVRRLVGLGPDRLASPPEYTPGEGTFAFLRTQPGTEQPVGYDPCRSIEYVVNPDGAPPDWEELIDTAVARTEWASGLDLEAAGTTEQRPFDPLRRAPFSGTTRPAVVGFADAEEIDKLAGDVAGLGGSLAMRDAMGRDYYVTGAVALDTAVFDGASRGRERELLQAIVDHELGHLVGLGHVDDPGELMYGENTGRTTYGPGDLEGLARLGSIPCR